MAYKTSSVNRINSLLFCELILLRFTSGPSFVPGAAVELEPGKTILDAYLDEAVKQAVQSHMGGGGGAGAGGGGSGEAGAGK